MAAASNQPPRRTDPLHFTNLEGGPLCPPRLYVPTEPATTPVRQAQGPEPVEGARRLHSNTKKPVATPASDHRSIISNLLIYSVKQN